MEILDILRARLTKLLDERAAGQAELDLVLAGVAAENRSEFNDDETTRFGELRTQIQAADVTIDETRQRITQIEESTAAATKAEETRAAYGTRPDAGEDKPKGGAKVEDPALYARRSGHSFFADAYAAHFRGDEEARQRVSVGQRQIQADVEKRAVTTSSFGGLIVPMYLVDEYAAIARAGRPLANAVRSLPLPETGVSAIIPRGTTGEIAAPTAENSGWAAQDFVETDLNIVVNLITSQQDMSRASFMRGGGLDDLIFGDMLSAYSTALDVQLISGTGTAPQHRGLLNVAGTNAVTFTTPVTVAGLWPKLADAIQRVNSNRFMPASVIVMHPTRWGWINAALDSQGRPLFQTSIPPAVNTMAVGTAAEYGQVVGQILGLPVVTDANIPSNLGAGTNEDRIFVLRAFDALLWEDAGGPMQFTFEQVVGPEKVRLALGSFSMFTAARYPTAISVIAGAGLIPPTF